jgi:aryl-alcohol dehydrogenase-like predicted oxidoreductase
MNFGTKENEERSFAILDRYVEGGGTFLDTSNNYAYWRPEGVGGESEGVLGRWLAERKNREKLFIATKVGFNTPAIGHSLSEKTIMKEVEGSLTRLGIECIDLYYAHKDHRDDPLEETLSAFNRLIEQGKVRFIGCSNTVAWRIERARNISRENGWAVYRCVQQRHTYLRPKPGASFGVQTAANDDLIDYCRENRDVTLLAYSPLLQGCYTRDDRLVPHQYAGADSDARLTVLREVAGETGATANQVVYAWMLQGNPSIIPLTAVSTVEQLNENLKSLEVRLSADQIERLDAAGAS